MSPSKDDKYQIKFRNKSVEKGWYALKNTVPDALERCKVFLQETPEDRLKSGGKLKKLKEKLNGILQYDVTDEARLWYRVDRTERIVYIEYIGHHP